MAWVAALAAAVITVIVRHAILNWPLKLHLRRDLRLHSLLGQDQGLSWPTPVTKHSDQELDSI